MKGAAQVVPTTADSPRRAVTAKSVRVVFAVSRCGTVELDLDLQDAW